MRKNQPVLVGTTSDREVRACCHDILKKKGVQSRRSQRQISTRSEAEIVAQAGPPGHGHDCDQHGRPRDRYSARRQCRSSCAQAGPRAKRNLAQGCFGAAEGERFLRLSPRRRAFVRASYYQGAGVRGDRGAVARRAERRMPRPTPRLDHDAVIEAGGLAIILGH